MSPLTTTPLRSGGGASLSEGYVEGDEVECPWHSGKFYIKDGRATTVPASEPIKGYRTQVVDGRVCIEAPQAAPEAG